MQGQFSLVLCEITNAHTIPTYTRAYFLPLVKLVRTWGKGGRCVWLTTYHPCSAKTSRNPGS